MPGSTAGSSLDKYGMDKTRALPHGWIPRGFATDDRKYCWPAKREPEKAANRENEGVQGSKPGERRGIFGSPIPVCRKRIPDFFNKRKKIDEVLMGFGLEEVEKFVEATRQEEIRASALDECFRRSAAESRPSPDKKRSGKFHAARRRTRDEDYDPDRDEALHAGRRESIPDEYMCEVLDYMKENPEHSTKTIMSRFTKIRYPSQITKFRNWRGSPIKAPNRYHDLASFCNKMCDETEASGGVVDDVKIKIWALQKAEELGLGRFGASKAWIANFRRNRRVSR